MMELEKLKSQLNSLESSQISKETLLRMVSVNGHPVLRRIRIQMIIESTAWILFLGFYYNFFDGHLKPIFWNLALIVSVALMLVHNSLNYQVTNNPISGENLVSSLVTYLKRLKKYAYLSILSRIIAILALFGFFISGIETLEQQHWIIVAGLVVTIGIQTWILWVVWKKKIIAISSSYQQLIKNE